VRNQNSPPNRKLRWLSLPRTYLGNTAAAAITGAETHTSMPASHGGMRAAVPRWSLSKTELVETVSAEIDNGSLVGDWEKLRDELTAMEREVRRSGSVAYSAPGGKHDDLVIAPSLCVFGCRHFGSVPQVRRRHASKGSWAAWT
jgi:hypothetical protein